MPRIINKLSPTDRLILLKIHNRAFPFSRWKKTSWNHFLDSDKGLVFCAIKKSGLYAGFVMGNPIDKNCSVVLLSALVVVKKYRRNGYGRKLVAIFLQTAFSVRSTEKVVLHFRETNKKTLLPYYKKLGFGNHKVCGAYTNGEAKHFLSITRRSFFGLSKNSLGQ
jgi:ribosomal protein S18 acetylase RimI-like enzyme